jgi:hypothetical protein
MQFNKILLSLLLGLGMSGSLVSEASAVQEFRYIRPPAKVKNKEFLRLNASILLSVPCSLFPVP